CVCDVDAYEQKCPAEKQKLLTFDNVSSCIRKSIWQEIPFREISFGEDIDWSKHVIEAGYKIVYEPNSAVIHSHNRSVWYETKRAYLTHRTLNETCGMQLIPSLKDLIETMPHHLRHNFNIIKQSSISSDQLYQLYTKAILLSFGIQFGIFLGGKRADYPKSWLFNKLDNVCSKGV
ncbi:MAG: hypothetical protein SCK29_12795, partial [Bacillota bacterium]|nr:hypothetical protein [Bacillota bacterium]